MTSKRLTVDGTTFARAVAVLESDFNLAIHEAWGDDEIVDTLTAIQKVEQTYLRK